MRGEGRTDSLFDTTDGFFCIVFDICWFTLAMRDRSPGCAGDLICDLNTFKGKRAREKERKGWRMGREVSVLQISG